MKLVLLPKPAVLVCKQAHGVAAGGGGGAGGRQCLNERVKTGGLVSDVCTAKNERKECGIYDMMSGATNMRPLADDNN